MINIYLDIDYKTKRHFSMPLTRPELFFLEQRIILTYLIIHPHRPVVWERYCRLTKL